MELAVVPVYQSEIMPREIRGFAVGSYQFSLMVSTPSILLIRQADTK
jgi:MFS transporter, SP family, sugar:H+ symporter